MIPYVGDVVGKGGKAVRYGKKAVDAIEAAKPAAKQADNAITLVVRQSNEVTCSRQYPYAATNKSWTAILRQDCGLQSRPKVNGKSSRRIPNDPQERERGKVELVCEPHIEIETPEKLYGDTRGLLMNVAK
ncbi:MAG: hypothetical protein NZ703_15515 [Gemmataceae bacterium]|nr:hypothetical protein [Gemmataceae bacterium]